MMIRLKNRLEGKNETMEVIRSTDNAKVKFWNNLKQKKYRDQHQLFIIQQKHLIQEALAVNALDTLIVREGVENIFKCNPVYVSDHVMKKLSENVSLNDYIGICHIRQDRLFDHITSAVVLEDLQDPGNVGTIIRTALSFGYDTVLMTKGCADIYNEKTIQASQGAIFHMNLIRMDLPEIYHYLRKNEIQIIATDLHQANWLTQCERSEKYAIVLGNEGKGLSEQACQLADQRIKIEMEHFESLNVAVAGAICMYDLKYRHPLLKNK